jgi:hypothetical protein
MTILIDTIDHSISCGKKRFSYDPESQFKVQVGKNKGSYSTRYSFTGNALQAFTWYRGINIGNGFKKRLTIDGQTICKAIS